MTPKRAELESLDNAHATHLAPGDSKIIAIPVTGKTVDLPLRGIA
jgi:hypothetical protein